MVRLTKLKIDRFRNVKPGTVLEFGPTFNVLLGKNATGKTTLLNLVAAVTNDDLSAYAEEDAGFDLTWWLEKGDVEFEVRAARTFAKTATSENVGEEESFDDVWGMVLRGAGTEAGRIEIRGARGSWKPQGHPDVPFDVSAGLVTRGAFRDALHALRRVTGAAAPGGAVVGAVFETLGSGGRIGRFDEALAVLSAITNSSFEVRENGYISLRGQWLPTQLSDHVRATSRDPLVVPLDQLDTLAKIPAILGLASAELRPRVLTGSQDGVAGVRTRYLGMDFLFRRTDGSPISHQFLSFGQKRLFSFLWYLAVRDQLPVVADELLNGLHHAWIEVCLDCLYDRQSFLSTQDPYLLDHIPIESVEGVRKSFIRCTLEAGPDGREQMVWRNFTEEEAERFFIAHQTGIQHVSEVLRTEGLW